MVGGSCPGDVVSLIHRIQVSAVCGVKSPIQRRLKERKRTMPTRNASAKWEGGLKGGRGSFSGESGLAGQYSFSSRFENGTGSNPEELLAAAQAACYSMALSAALEGNGTPGVSIETTAHCTIEKVGAGFSITKMQLDVRAKVEKVDDATFQRLAKETKEGCPVSKSLKGNVDMQVTATLT